MNQVEKTELIRKVEQLAQGLRNEHLNRMFAYILYACAIIWLTGLALHRSSGTEKLPGLFVSVGVVLSLFLVASHILTITNFRNLKATRDALETLRTELEHQEVRCSLQDSLLSITWQSAPDETKILLVNHLIDQMMSKDRWVERHILDHYLQDLPESMQELVRMRCREIHHQAAEEIRSVTDQEIRTKKLACPTTIKASLETMEKMRRILGLIPDDLPSFTTMGLP